MRKTSLFVLVITLLLSFPLPGLAVSRPFALVSDSHIGLSDAIYRAVIAELDKEGITTIIHTGDAIHTYGDVRQWESFLDITGREKEVRLAPGNHDVRDRKSNETYLKFFPRTYYSFSEDDTLFVILDTAIPGEEHRITNDQLSWLKTVLREPFTYKLVFLHEPPYPVVPFHGLDRYRTARDELHQLFVDAGVSLVVSGHDHYYKRIQKDGVVYVVMGATGGRLTLLERNGDFFSYILASRNGEGYAFSVKDLQGIERDRFSVTPWQYVYRESPASIRTDQTAVTLTILNKIMDLVRVTVKKVLSHLGRDEVSFTS